MLRLCGLLLLGLTLACTEPPPPPAPRTWPRSQNSGLGTVTSVERVHITRGFTVFRGDTQEEVTVHEGLLIKLQGLNWTEFMPRAMPPPSLVLGDSYVEMIVDPFSFRSSTVILTEAPPPGTEVGLWMTPPWEGPTLSRGAEFKKAQTRELGAKGRGVNIRTPAAEAPVSSYLSLEVLREKVGGRRSMNGVPAPELCAHVQVACGFKETAHGRIDCGVCPQGQTCTADNTCCTPATCASLGRSCGTVVPDGCGFALDCGACPVR
ncbi:branched-chain amino acid ABC transporter2C amino acid-binding protein [Corallococcus coralloides]|uniref:Branched-chain amino acid ABC transporter2C amino acid-binding protein n=1 Tax=Corallococcus coralloides TaxID=184914 RepID=A0A410RSF6_CORCK|nr:hypothetical protein [Corallococcus coralloides]QAT84818.1 branched-chain amino acid ABC transporter2C amino acid-binding protein [Corallococcus coralloides]